MVGMAATVQIAVELLPTAGGQLHLQRRMFDAVALAQQTMDIVDELIAGIEGAIVAHLHVRREEPHPGGDRPDMEIVDGFHSRYPHDIIDQPDQVDVARRRLHQDVHGLAQQVPRAIYDDERDAERDERVRVLPSGKQDDQAADDDAGRCSYVAHRVQHCRARIQVLRLVGAQSQCDVQIHGDPRGGRYEHRQWHNGLRITESPEGLVSDPSDDEEKRNRIEQGRENAAAMVSVGVARVGRTLRAHGREQGECDRYGVRKDVPCVGQEGQGMREQTADKLHDQNQQGKEERASQPIVQPLAGAIMGMLLHHTNTCDSKAAHFDWLTLTITQRCRSRRPYSRAGILPALLPGLGMKVEDYRPFEELLSQNDER